MGRVMELNADVGEGGADTFIVPHVQRASIACGGHAGDVASMRGALMLCHKHDVMAGAHPSYPDRGNFGRAIMPAQPADITRWVVEQTRDLQAVADELGVKLFHVKPHGALYNRAAVDEETAQAVIAAMRELDGLALVALAASPLVAWARAAGVEVLEEAFADRRYTSEGRLAPRGSPGAVIEDPNEVCAQAQKIVAGVALNTLDGGVLSVRADTLCLHGEGPRAAEFARLVRAVLKECST